MKQLLYVFAFVASGVALAACGGGSTNPPAPGPTCSPPNGTQTALVYPAPGASGVVNSNGQVVIGSTAALPTGQSGQNWGIVIVDAASGTVPMPGALVNTNPPFPNPNQTPPFANPVYQTQAFGAPFASGQTVNVYVNNFASNCSPLLLGSFST
jgi:hypothetical protein